MESKLEQHICINPAQISESYSTSVIRPIINDGKVIYAVISPKHFIKIELQQKDKRTQYRSK